MDLLEISKDINRILDQKRNELNLSFIEDTHTYFMKDLDGIVKSTFPSVSSVLKLFYTEFPTQEKSYKKANGDLVKQQEIIKEWKATADYATNMGSRAHFELEKYLVSLYGNYKEVRQPIFQCDAEQTIKSDLMICAGKRYIDMMINERNCVLLDTEIVLGSPELGYTGQPDKVWLVLTKKDELVIIVSDHKTNKPKNFEVQWYTQQMKEPFNDYPDTALSHYYCQLPLYGRLLLDMLKGTKYEKLKVLRNFIVLLKQDGTFEEYKVPDFICETIMGMDIKSKLKNFKKVKS